MLIFRQELRFQWRSWLAWAIALLLLISLYMLAFPMFENEAEAFTDMIKSLPSFMTNALGMDFDAIFRFDGYTAFTNVFLKLLLAISGALWGLQICGRETIRRMGEFLLCKPQKRVWIILQKVLAGLVLMLLLNLAIFGVMLFFKVSHGGSIQDWQGTLEASVLDFLLQFFFFALGGALGMSLKRIKNPIAIASGLGFIFFMLMMLGRVIQRELVLKMTPFYYTDQTRYVMEGFNTTDCMILLAASIFLLLAGILYFVKKDVEA